MIEGTTIENWEKLYEGLKNALKNILTSSLTKKKKVFTHKGFKKHIKLLSAMKNKYSNFILLMICKIYDPLKNNTFH